MRLIVILSKLDEAMSAHSSKKRRRLVLTFNVSELELFTSWSR